VIRLRLLKDNLCLSTSVCILSFFSALLFLSIENA